MAEDIKSALKLKSLFEQARDSGKAQAIRVSDGLYLQVKSTGGARWVWRYSLHGLRREMGLGAYPEVEMSKAKAESAKAKLLVNDGIDPIDTKRAAAAEAKAKNAKDVTFEIYALGFIADRRERWANQKHAAQWESTLRTYAFPRIGKKPISQVTTDDVLAILKPIWRTKHETASRVRSRIEQIMASAKFSKLFAGENPATWREHLDQVLDKPSDIATVEHHAAMPYAELPAFMDRLKQMPGNASLALQFLILTAARTSEVLNATWDEVQDDLWVIPKERMKAKKPHRVPLTAAALEILNLAPRLMDNPYIFPGMKEGRSLSNLAMTMLLRRMSRHDITVHGFRSTFRDWAAEETSFANIVAEQALAHTISNAVEAAYRRGDLLAKRRELMEAWSAFTMETPQVER